MRNAVHQVLRPFFSILPLSLSAASTDGTYVDTYGYEEALIIFNAGLAAGAAESDVTIRQSANSDGSSSTVITGATFTQITTANDNTIYVGRIDLKQGAVTSRYIGARNVGDGANAVVIAVTILMSSFKYPPVTQANTTVFDI